MTNNGVLMTMIAILLGIALIGGACWGNPKYRVYNQEHSGKAALARAEWERKVQIVDAEGKERAAVALAKAEVARARGVAEANKIIGGSLQGNEAYLTWLWIQSLEGAAVERIYIPTEANLPILEAGRALGGVRTPSP